MARNGSGTMAVTNTFAPQTGQAISSTQMDANFTDFAAEVTNSVAADGQTTITGALKGFAGTVGAPGYTFSSDTDSGMYRIGANNIGLAVNGAKVLDIATTGLSVVGTITASTTIEAPSGFTVGGNNIMPPGIVFPYAGSSAPNGFLLCYGQAVSRSTYAALFAILSTTFGTGDGSTTFNLPDLRGRTIGGKDDMGGSAASRLTSTYFGTSAAALGAVGGLESHQLTVSQMPAHAHTGSTVTPANPVTSITSNSIDGNAGGNSYARTAVTTAAVLTIASQGGDGSHNNVQPTMVLNYIIKF